LRFLFLRERETSFPKYFILTLNCGSIAVVPEVTIDGDETQFKARGYDMQLTCRYNASPPVAEVLWKKDGIVIARNISVVANSSSVVINSSRINITHYNESQIQLTINTATPEDAGNYTCDVRNDVGNSSDTTVIVIEGVF